MARELIPTRRPPDKNAGAKEMRRRIRDVFKFRDWAVHPGSKFRKPIIRPDVDGLDWHFAVFRGENAVNAGCTDCLPVGSAARRTMIDEYRLSYSWAARAPFGCVRGGLVD